MCRFQGYRSREGKSLLDRGLAHIQSSVEEGSKGSRIGSLRAENRARISGALWGGPGGQEMRSGLGRA